MLGARGVQVFTGLLYYAYTIEGDLYSFYDRSDAFPSEPSPLRIHLQIFGAFCKELREKLRYNDVFLGYLFVALGGSNSCDPSALGDFCCKNMFT